MRSTNCSVVSILLGTLAISCRPTYSQTIAEEVPHLADNPASLNTPAHLEIDPIETATRVQRQLLELEGRTLKIEDRIEVSLTENKVTADGRSVLHMRIRVFDADDHPIETPVKVSLDTKLGRFRLADGRLVSSSYALVNGGQKDLEVVASTIAGSNVIRVTSGPVSAAGKMNFIAQARPLFLVGIADFTRTVGKSTGDDVTGKIGQFS